MKLRIFLISVLCLTVVKCDNRNVNFPKDRIQKRSYHHHGGSFNELSYHLPGALPFAAPNPFLFKAQPYLPPVAPAPAFPKFVPGDAWVTQQSVTFPKYPVLQPPIIPTPPLLPQPHLIPAPAVRPFGFAPPPPAVLPHPLPPPVTYVPKPIFAPIPRPVIPQFIPAAVHPVVKPVVPVLAPAPAAVHPVVAVQPTVSSENPENPPIHINIPDQSNHEQNPEMSEESESPDQSNHSNNIPFVPSPGLPPTFVMQISPASGGGSFDTSPSSQSPSQSPSPAAFPSSPSRPTFTFNGMVPQMIPIHFMPMQMMPHQQPHQPEASDLDPHNFNFNPQTNYGAPPYLPPHHQNTIRNNRLRNLRQQQQKPKRNNFRQKPFRRHPKKQKFTIIKHHHDKK